MRQLDRNSLHHTVECLRCLAVTRWHTLRARLAMQWWGVHLATGYLFSWTDWHTDDPRTGPDAPGTSEKGVCLGFNVTVYKGVTIGENTFVTVGSMVTRSLPVNAVAGGIPAMVFKQIHARHPGAKQ